MKYYIDYYSAVNWLGKDLILFNDIHEIDEEFFCELYKEDEDGDLGDPIEIFQYFLTNFTTDEVRWMEKTFPKLHFAYSQKLDLWILCVDHYGTSWDYVWTECELDWVMKSENMGWNEKDEAHYTIARNINTRFMRCK